MSEFEGWLRQQQIDREVAGLQRSLIARAPHTEVIDLAGNDYLGLTTDHRVIAAAQSALAEWGSGAGASRLVTGTLELHADLERELASFTGRPSALLFSTGYQANLGVVTSLSNPDTLIVSDAHIHASLVDACRLSRCGRLEIAAHNDIAAVETALAARTETRALILCESVYSVLGDAAPLVKLGDLAAQYNAVLIVDEAHALGVAGRGGRGLVEEAGLAHRTDVVSTITLSKSLASQGGAVLASPAVLDQLINTARPFIYDTALSPAATAGAQAAAAIISDEPGLSGRACEIASAMAAALEIPAPAGAVLSVPMAGPSEALREQAAFAADGFRVGCFRPPSAPDGISRLRLTARATLTNGEVDSVLDRLAKVPSLR